MMTWAVIAMVAGLAWVVYGPVLRRSSSARTLHFRNGVCEENEIGVWKYLRHLGLRRELGEGAVAGGARQRITRSDTRSSRLFWPSWSQ